MLYPYLILGLLSRPWTSYWVEDGEAAVGGWLRGTKRVMVSASHIDIAQGPLQKLLGFGDLVFRGDEGAEIMRWRKLRAVEDVRERVRSAGKSGERFPALNAHSGDPSQPPAFRTAQARAWDRPRPVMLPEALEAKGWTDGNPVFRVQIVMAPDGSRLGATTEHDLVFLVNPEDGNLMQSIMARNCGPIALGCSGQVTFVSSNGTVSLCGSDADTADTCPKVFDKQEDFDRPFGHMSNREIAVSADSRWFAAGKFRSLGIGEMPDSFCSSPALTVRSIGRPDPDRGFYYELYPDLDAIAWHPESRWLALTGMSGNIWIYDPALDRFLSSHGHLDRALMTLLPGSDEYGRHMSDKACLPWPAAGLSSRVHSISMDASGSLVGLLSDRSVTLLRIETQQSSLSPGKSVRIEQLGTIKCIEGGLHALAISPDSQLVAAAGQGGVIRIWEAETHRLLYELCCNEYGEQPRHSGLAFHPNNRWLFSAGLSGLIRRWTLTTQHQGSGVRGTCDRGMEALPGGNWVVWNDPDGPNRRWIDVSDESKRWLGWQMPSGEYRPFDAF